MPLDLSTKTTVAARQTIAYCEHLPPKKQYVAVPQPEAGRFVCPHPCGRPCRLDQAPRYQVAVLRRHACHLQLPETLALLTELALQPAPPLACDLGAPAVNLACGVVHLN